MMLLKIPVVYLLVGISSCFLGLRLKSLYIPDQLLAHLVAVVHHPLVVLHLTVLGDLGILYGGDEEGAGETHEAQLSEEWASNGGSSGPTKRPHGVCGYAGWLVPVGGEGEVVQQVGEGGGEGAVVLWRHNDKPLGLLYYLMSIQHPLGGLGLVLTI